jgi:hypothetical protein
VETATSTSCPSCSFEHDDGIETCLRCGVVFAKVRTDWPTRKPTFSASIPTQIESTGPVWKLLAFGLIGAAIAHAVPFLRFILSPLVTLLHEFGHAVVAWLLGCPAIPAFDFVYGGGVTYHRAFQLPLAIIIGVAWTWLGWTFRRNPRTLVVLGLCTAVWLVAVSSDWRREVAISSMGHGGELILAAVLLYMALSGVGWRIPELERPLGAFAAFFVQFQTMQFAWNLRNDDSYLAWYRDGKGGAMMNDLEVVALDLKIWMGLSLDIRQVAGGLLVFSVITLAVSVLLFVFRAQVNAFARSLLLLDS